MKKRFPADMKTPASARRFVTSELRGVLGPDDHPQRDEVVLIVSELVTNAVRAGAGSVEVELTVRPRRLDLDVADDAGGWPAPRSASIEDPGGRGLAIVDQLADSWEAFAEDAGKRVRVTWFR